jgi:TPP-dependent indolepyruvate ferredoxin oxidoreductase alpha subunit
VDRSGDALKHGNAYGASRSGGVLVVAGDDRGCVSSSMPHQSEHVLMAWSMPVLNPANIEDRALHQVRIDLQQADAILACDLVVAAMPDALSVMR